MMVANRRNGHTPTQEADPPPVTWQGEVDFENVRQSWQRNRPAPPPAAPPPAAPPATPFGGGTERWRGAVADPLADWSPGGGLPLPANGGQGGRGGRLVAPPGGSGSLRLPRFRRLWWAYGLAA